MSGIPKPLLQNLQVTIASLRATIAHFDQSADFAADDPALATLKGLLLARIAELESLNSDVTARNPDTNVAPLPPVDPPPPDRPA